MVLLVSGGAGFIGTHFVRMAARMPEVSQVIVFDAFTYASHQLRSDGKILVEQGNLRDDNKVLSVLRKHPIDWVVHMAAETHVDRSIVDPERFVKTNVLGTANLLRAVRECGRKVHQFLYVSTDEVYGTVLNGMATEESPVNPSSPYSASKAGGELLCIAEHITHGQSIVITRGTNTFGPGQNREKLIPLSVTKIMRGEPVPIYGDGKQARDWMAVEDHCSGIWAALKLGMPGHIYNLGACEIITNLDLVSFISSIIKSEGGPHAKFQHVTDRKGHDRRYAVDPGKAECMLNWRPKRSVALYLQDTVKSYM